MHPLDRKLTPLAVPTRPRPWPCRGRRWPPSPPPQTPSPRRTTRRAWRCRRSRAPAAGVTGSPLPRWRLIHTTSTQPRQLRPEGWQPASRRPPTLREVMLLRGAGRLSQERIHLLPSWRHSGFSVHTSVTVPPDDRDDLHRLARYLLRPPGKPRVLGGGRAGPGTRANLHAPTPEPVADLTLLWRTAAAGRQPLPCLAPVPGGSVTATGAVARCAKALRASCDYRGRAPRVARLGCHSLDGRPAAKRAWRGRSSPPPLPECSS